MKKLIIILLLLSTVSAFAIDWEILKSKGGNVFELDKDSIKEKNGYYFFNIKVSTDNQEDVVITMQSQKSHPFSARINHYKLYDYENLNGDYENITKNITKQLEPVSYKSRAYSAYIKVREIKSEENKPKITF